MDKTIQFGRRIVPVEQIALLEPFDPETQKNMRSQRPFKSRIVLLNRDSILSEREVGAIAEEHGFRMLPKDGVATNPMINFSVETFQPTADFQPAKAYVSRLMWRDLDSNTQSKLMLTEAEDLIKTVVRGEAPKGESPERAASPARRPRRRRQAAASTPEPRPEG